MPMRLIAAVLAVLGLAWVGLGLAEERGEGGFVDTRMVIAFVTLLVLLVGMAIGWLNPYGRVFRRMRQSWTRAMCRR